MEALLEQGSGDQAVYCYSFDDGSRSEERYPIKIGRALKCPFRRIKTQQASMQHEPVIDLVIWTDDAKWLEARIHERLSDRQLATYGREWFQTNVEEILASTQEDIPGSEVASLAEIGSLVRRTRVSKGISQIDLAALANVRQATISIIENGKGDVKLTTLLAVLAALDLRLRATSS